ncbi:AmmeMemoRadiSam system protein B [Candidatus Latescibacterota bacterium]
MVRFFSYILALICWVVVPACDGHSETELRQEGSEMTIDAKDIRPAVLAGSWYEGNPDVLRRMVRSYIDEAEAVPVSGTIIGLIAPHAGHIYSGPVAGHAYKTVMGKSYDTVVIVAPNHADPRLNFTSVYTRGAYQTPLGVVPVDGETAKAIVDYKPDDTIRESDLGHTTAYSGRWEHSIEIQLPFLHVALGKFQIVPIVMGDRERESEASHALGEAIANAVRGKNALVIASTDLSHFHDVSTLRKLDNVARESIEAFDPDAFLRSLETGETEACGGIPVAAVMITCRNLGASTARVLNMGNSGDVSGDYSSAVGYLAAVITNSEEQGAAESTEKVGVELGISEEEKQVLRDVVEETLKSVVNGGPVPEYTDFSGRLGEQWGAFVTLTIKGQLRGCIGNIVGTQPLIKTVADMTRAAALEDPRFPPVSPRELPAIEYEISVLTPIRRVENLDNVVIGRDGLIITKGRNRGLLLPQVATEYGWDRTTFLEQTCVKAGLPRDAWKDGDTLIEMFSAQVFH